MRLGENCTSVTGLPRRTVSAPRPAGVILIFFGRLGFANALDFGTTDVAFGFLTGRPVLTFGVYGRVSGGLPHDDPHGKRRIPARQRRNRSPGDARQPCKRWWPRLRTVPVRSIPPAVKGAAERGEGFRAGEGTSSCRVRPPTAGTQPVASGEGPWPPPDPRRRTGDAAADPRRPPRSAVAGDAGVDSRRRAVAVVLPGRAEVADVRTRPGNDTSSRAPVPSGDSAPSRMLLVVPSHMVQLSTTETVARWTASVSLAHWTSNNRETAAT